MNIGGFGDTTNSPLAEGKKMMRQNKFDPEPRGPFKAFITEAKSTAAHEAVEQAAMNGGQFPIEDVETWVEYLYKGQVDRAFAHISEAEEDGAKAANGFVQLWGDDDDWEGVTDTSGLYS